jgi:acetyl-CoA carboxylase carboxyltransferase component
MGTIAREAAASAGKELDEEALTKRQDEFRASVIHDSRAYYTSANLLDDGIIDPRDTRDVLGMCLEIVEGERVSGNEGFRGVSRM